MLRISLAPSRPAFRPRVARGLAGIALATVLGTLAAPAQAQSSACLEGGKYINERKALVGRLQALAKNKVSPKEACAMFGKLVANGTSTLKWAEANKDWCQVPDQFIEGMKNDHERALKLRSQACGAAAKQAEMEKRAREGGQQGGLLGGGGLEGTYRIPQGAL